MKLGSIFFLAAVALPFSATAAVITVAGPGGDFLVSNNLLAGASDASYSEPGAFGGQDTAQPDSWGGDRRWGNDGASTEATWLFGGLDNGVYEVYASWRNGAQANVSNAQYTGTDGFGAITFDQAPGAAAFPGVVLNDGIRDVNFVSLGQVAVADGDFSLSVNDGITGIAVNTFIFADAVAIQSVVPEPSGIALLGLGLLPLLRRRR
jgi:MYXO-CTERM domain-containing protein